jgi:hypothetical protein
MNDLTDADDIFLTSSVIGVTPVTTFDFAATRSVQEVRCRSFEIAFAKLVETEAVGRRGSSRQERPASCTCFSPTAFGASLNPLNALI